MENIEFFTAERKARVQRELEFAGRRSLPKTAMVYVICSRWAKEGTTTWTESHFQSWNNVDICVQTCSIVMTQGEAKDTAVSEFKGRG